MRSAAFILSIMLAGCATGGDAQIYTGGLVGQRVVGNEAYVTVFNVWNEMDALPLADGHCGKFNKVAKFSRMEGIRAIYDCVPRS